jgi:hypothetical protein
MGVASKRRRSGLERWLSRPWWVGVGVILAAALTAVGFFLTSGDSTSYSNHGGNCVAQGNNNTVNCSSAGSGMNP